MIEYALRGLVKQIYEDANLGISYTGDYESEIQTVITSIRTEILAAYMVAKRAMR